MNITKMFEVCDLINELYELIKTNEVTQTAMRGAALIDPDFGHKLSLLSDLFNVDENVPSMSARIKVDKIDDNGNIEKGSITSVNLIEPIKVAEPVITTSTETIKPTKKAENVSKKDVPIRERFPSAYNFLRSKDLDYFKSYDNRDILNVFTSKFPKCEIGRNLFYQLIKEVKDEKSSYVKKDDIVEIKDFTDEEIINENWKISSIASDILVSDLGRVKVNGEIRKPFLRHGYLTVSIHGSTANKNPKGGGCMIGVAKLMLQTWRPIADNETSKYIPNYNDGDKTNCRLSNLNWTDRNNTTETWKIVEACEIIAANPKLGFDDLLKVMIKEKKGVGSTALKSILAGKYKNISDKYFSINNYGIITPVNIPVIVEETINEPDDIQDMTEDDDDIDKTIILNNKGDIVSVFKLNRNLEYAIQLFKKKIEMGMTLTDDDIVIPVLQFIKDDAKRICSTDDILENIKFEYGDKIDHSLLKKEKIYAIKSKKFRKDISDIVF